MAVTHQDYMQQAIELAQKAQAMGEVPVGALVVLNGQVIGKGCNQPIATHDPTAHAEVMALRDAANTLGNYRLTGAALYVTLEPCVMCAGAIVHARIGHVVFGADDVKEGAVKSKHRLFEGVSSMQWSDGVCANACEQLLKDFFKAKRG